MVPSYVLYLVQELKDQVELLVCVDNIKQLEGQSLYQFHATRHLCNPSTLHIVQCHCHIICCKAFMLSRSPEQCPDARALSKARSLWKAINMFNWPGNTPGSTNHRHHNNITHLIFSPDRRARDSLRFCFQPDFLQGNVLVGHLASKRFLFLKAWRQDDFWFSITDIKRFVNSWCQEYFQVSMSLKCQFSSNF